MRVAAVQFKPPKGDVPAARERLAALARSAAAGSDLVVLPEMAVTGYVFADADAIRPVTEAPEGATFQLLSAIARDASTWIVGGFAERADGALYNSAWIIDPRGDLVDVYRKTMLFVNDHTWATPGDSGYKRIEADFGAFGVGICMDLNDDRFIDWCARADIDAIAFPTNWVKEPASPVDTWNYWAWRIDGVNATLVAANTYGPEQDIEFCGRSLILRDRTALAAAPATGDAIIRAEV